MIEQEIARDIILKMIEQGLINRSDYPEAKTTAEVISLAYKEIFNAVKEL